MHSYKRTTIILMIVFLCFFVGRAQDTTFIIPDSLQSISYDDLLNRYSKVYQDTLKSKIYLNTYYRQAIIDDDNVKKAMALGHISYYLEDQKRIEVLDLAIHYAKESENKNSLMTMYTLAGGYYLLKSYYDEALDFYFKSLVLAEEIQNEDYIYINKHNIAIIKGDIGDFKESLKLLKECYNREVRIGDNSYLYDYLSSCLYLSEAFIRTKQLDSANFYLEKVFTRANDSYSDIAELASVYKYISNGNYKQLDYKNLSSSLEDIKSQGNSAHRILVVGNYHAGLISQALDYDNSKKHFEKVDSLYNNNGIYIPEVGLSLENLIKHYKRKANPEKQLYYMDKLLKFDSIYNKKRTSLGDKILTYYDIPVLLSEKEKLIKNLGKQNTTLSYSAGLLLTSVLILFSIAIFLFQRNKKLKHRFNSILVTTNDLKNIDVTRESVKEIQIKKELTISSKIIEEVLSNLSQFEVKKEFINKNLTSSLVAKKVGTNSKYLSQIVNHYKEKTLTTYINDLRINEAIHLLQSNSKLLNYTIQSIAEEVGFNNAESFSKAFFKKTGLKPSYFIKQLRIK